MTQILKSYTRDVRKNRCTTETKKETEYLHDCPMLEDDGGDAMWSTFAGNFAVHLSIALLCGTPGQLWVQAELRAWRSESRWSSPVRYCTWGDVNGQMLNPHSQ